MINRGSKSQSIPSLDVTCIVWRWGTGQGQQTLSHTCRSELFTVNRPNTKRGAKTKEWAVGYSFLTENTLEMEHEKLADDSCV